MVEDFLMLKRQPLASSMLCRTSRKSVFIYLISAYLCKNNSRRFCFQVLVLFYLLINEIDPRALCSDALHYCTNAIYFYLLLGGFFEGEWRRKIWDVRSRLPRYCGGRLGNRRGIRCRNSRRWGGQDFVHKRCCRLHMWASSGKMKQDSHQCLIIGLATIVVSFDLAMRMSRKTSGNEATGKSRMSWIGNRTIVSYRILGVATYQESQGIQRSLWVLWESWFNFGVWFQRVSCYNKITSQTGNLVLGIRVSKLL